MTEHQHRPLRIAAFHVEPEAYKLVRDWAARAGHEIVLLVTTPGPPPRTYLGYRQVVAAAPVSTEVLITTRFRRATPIVAAARPDLILSYTFPSRLPDELIAVAPLGGVNLHPSPLPRFRGGNPHRMIYEGQPTIGATLHRMAAAFDAGPTLSVQEAALPAPPTVESVRALYERLILAALDDGVARAVAGEPGIPQDEARASLAPGFTDDEFWLDWRLPADKLRRQVVALNLVEPRALAVVAGTTRLIHAVTPARGGGPFPDGPPGAVLRRGGVGELIVMTGSGPAMVIVGDESMTAVPDSVRISFKAPRRPSGCAAE